MLKKLLGALIVIFCMVISDSAFSENLKLGYINMREIFYEYKKTKDFNQKLEKEDEEAKVEIEKRSKNLKRMRDELDLLSDDAKKKKGKELEKAMRDLDDYRKDKVEDFVRRKDEMFQEIREDIMGVASAYAKENKYDLILDKAVFIYSSEEYDITAKMLSELNK